jgi:PAS domain S-box-containing protein
MLFLSDRIESLVGVPAAEFLADRVALSELFHPDDAEQVHCGVREGVSQRASFHLEYRLKHARGHWVWVEEYGVGVFDSAGELKFLEGAIFDISSRKELERERQTAFDEIARLKDELERERNYLRQEVREALHVGAIVGQSPHLLRVIEQIEAVAPTPSNVLILGESGVGKELVAREIHARSPRDKMPLVKVNCGGIHPNLFESEFFGHVKGSFSGAHRDHIGRFELAAGGTIFLDEVGEIPLELQSKLLRVLQEKEFERVGDETVRSVDVRVIAATNRDLEAEVKRGKFREDL